MVFALEVEGFRVAAARGWSESLAGTSDLACLVVDADSYRREPGLRSALAAANVPAIYLSDGLARLNGGKAGTPDATGSGGLAASHSPAAIHELAKPFQGEDLIALVCRLATGKPVRT